MTKRRGKEDEEEKGRKEWNAWQEYSSGPFFPLFSPHLIKTHPFISSLTVQAVISLTVILQINNNSLGVAMLHRTFLVKGNITLECEWFLKWRGVSSNKAKWWTRRIGKKEAEANFGEEKRKKMGRIAVRNPYLFCDN